MTFKNKQFCNSAYSYKYDHFVLLYNTEQFNKIFYCYEKKNYLAKYFGRYKKLLPGQVQWLMPVIAELWEAELVDHLMPRV